MNLWDILSVVLGLITSLGLVVLFLYTAATGAFERMVHRFYNYVNRNH